MTAQNYITKEIETLTSFHVSHDGQNFCNLDCAKKIFPNEG